METFHGLQLHDDAPFDKQVQFEPAADALAVVIERDMQLAFDTQVLPSQFDDLRSEDPDALARDLNKRSGDQEALLLKIRTLDLLNSVEKGGLLIF